MSRRTYSMYVTPREASKYYSVSEQALRCWANSGTISFNTTQGGHRRYFVPTKGKGKSHFPAPPKKKVVYARVSSKRQEEDLRRQVEYLKSQYPEHHVVTDIGSGINFKRKGFRGILEGVFAGTISEAVVTHRDRFSRFGWDLFTWIFQKHNALLRSDKSEHNKDGQEELSEDLLSIITVFTARYHGSRRYQMLAKDPNVSS